MPAHQRAHCSYPIDYSQEEGVQSGVQVEGEKRNKDEEGPGHEMRGEGESRCMGERREEKERDMILHYCKQQCCMTK